MFRTFFIYYIMKSLVIKIDGIEYKPQVYKAPKKESSTICDHCDLKNHCVELHRNICSTFYPLRSDILFKNGSKNQIFI